MLETLAEHWEGQPTKTHGSNGKNPGGKREKTHRAPQLCTMKIIAITTEESLIFPLTIGIFCVTLYLKSLTMQRAKGGVKEDNE